MEKIYTCPTHSIKRRAILLFLLHTLLLVIYATLLNEDQMKNNILLLFINLPSFATKDIIAQHKYLRCGLTYVLYTCTLA